MSTEITDRERDPTPSTATERACEDCGGRVIPDAAQREFFCRDCGLIVPNEGAKIDRGPDWRAFNPEQREKQPHTGPPSTQSLHDRGLSTYIGWGDQDANGNPIPSRKRFRISRQRTHNSRSKTPSKTERNRKDAFGDISLITDQLGLSSGLNEQACRLFKQAHEAGLLPGRSIEAFATTCVYAVARLNDQTITLTEVAETIDDGTTIDTGTIWRCYRALNEELSIPLPIADINHYVPKYTSELNLSDDIERQVERLLSKADDTDPMWKSGKNPRGLSAAAIYLATIDTSEQRTQAEIAQVCEVTPPTIRTRYTELADLADVDL